MDQGQERIYGKNDVLTLKNIRYFPGSKIRERLEEEITP